MPVRIYGSKTDKILIDFQDSPRQEQDIDEWNTAFDKVSIVATYVAGDFQAFYS